MKYFVMAVLFILSLILQSTLFSHLTVAGVKPDLVLILVIFFALLYGPKDGAIVGFIGGLIQDLLFGHDIGMNLLVKTIIGGSFGFLEQRIYKENLFIPMIAVFVGTFFHDSLVFFFNLAEGASAGYFASVRSVILSAAVYNACLVPIIYRKFYNSSHKGHTRFYDYNR